MIPRDDVSLRKISRKLSDDGLAATMVSGAELFSRKSIFTPLLRRLVDSDRISTVSAKDSVDKVYSIESNVSENSPSAETSPYVTGLGDAYVLSTMGMGLTARGQIVGETVSGPESRNHKTAVVLGRHLFLDGPRFVYDVVRGRTADLDKRAESVGAVCPLIPRYRNYFHWTIECLPRVRAVREFERQTGEDVTFLVPDDLPGWIAESLELVGCEPAEIQAAESAVYRTENLVVSSFPRPTAADCRWIRERVLANATVDEADIETGSNVYVSRHDAKERRVLNEAEVVETLSGYGFQSYRLEELSVAEQAKLFDDADLVVGAHGAGLSNLIYSQDSGVLELFGSKVKSNYARLSETVGHTYDSMECEPSGVDLVVDTDRLSEAVERLEERRTSESASL